MSDQFICDEIDDGECSTCGGEGYIDGDCDCMDDTCCCLYPTPPECPECAYWAKRQRISR